jgi:uncharacterized protein (DUF58 family)
MIDATAESPSYLDPKALAKISSLELRARTIVEGLTSGQHRSPYHGISVEFAQHRPYVQGDDTRHVDWKVLAKTDRIHLKQYMEETNLQVICLVDASESMGFGTVAGERAATWSKYDHAAAITVALSYLVVQQQDAVGLGVFDQTLKKFLKPANSRNQWQAIARELQGAQRVHKTNTGKILAQLAEKLTHRSLIVVISDFLDDLPGIQKGIRQLRYRKHELILFQVLDPAEIEFPFEHALRFAGLENTGDLLADPRWVREAYLEQLALLTDQLKTMCRGLRIDYFLLNTAESLGVSLSNFLAKRASVSR